MDVLTDQSFDAVLKHWAVIYRQKGVTHMDAVVGINADQIGIEGSMVHF